MIRHPLLDLIWNRKTDHSRVQAIFLDSLCICSTGECSVVHLVKARVASSFRGCGAKWKAVEIIFHQSEGMFLWTMVRSSQSAKFLPLVHHCQTGAPSPGHIEISNEMSWSQWSTRAYSLMCWSPQYCSTIHGLLILSMQTKNQEKWPAYS